MAAWDLADVPACVPSIYLGGGTPSLLSPANVERLLVGCSRFASVDLKDVREIAIEVDPATTSAEHLAGLAGAGITRINLGYQTTDPAELITIGRNQARRDVSQLKEHAARAGIDNVCIDLIYGLPGQTVQSWETSLTDVISVAPETICAYPLTRRPYTGFDKLKGSFASPQRYYRLYDIAHDRLTGEGYRQESNVRWTKAPHGYLQKSLHWSSENILGFGAGARSYLKRLDTRNGYSVRRRVKPIRNYLRSIAGGTCPITEGFVLRSDERMRKAMILGLGLVSNNEFATAHGVEMHERFGEELDLLEKRGLIEVSHTMPQYTPRGWRHRDSVVQLFMSDEVRAAVMEFDYDE